MTRRIPRTREVRDPSELPRLRSGFRQRARTPALRLNFGPRRKARALRMTKQRWLASHSFFREERSRKGWGTRAAELFFRPCGARSFSTISHGLRRGLYSFAASRLYSGGSAQRQTEHASFRAALKALRHPKTRGFPTALGTPTTRISARGIVCSCADWVSSFSLFGYSYPPHLQKRNISNRGRCIWTAMGRDGRRKRCASFRRKKKSGSFS